MIYVYSDTHYDHANIIKYCHRPPDWQEQFLRDHRRIVSSNDTVLFLGDLGFGSPEKMRSILDELFFKRFITILGNHDRSTQWLLDSGVDVVLNEHGQGMIIQDKDYPVEVVLVARDKDPRVGKTEYPWVAISHEPYENIGWPYLRGHTHNNPVPWDYTEAPYRLHRFMGRNVSVEMVNYCPIPIPFLIGDERWIKENHEHYYKHLFGFVKRRKRRDARKGV